MKSNAGQSKLPLWKKGLFSLLPLLLLLGGAELFVRVTGLDRPKLQNVPLPEEEAGIFRPDPELFWVLQPGLDRTWEGAHVKVNAAGLRGPEIEPRQPGELRILSLGESSTFGVGVDDGQTYSALLEQELAAVWTNGPVTVLNAGVPAWSSFQSWKFLENRDAELKPDLVLFYHELNDYLPSTLRDSSNNELGAMKTDEQLYASRSRGLARTLEAHSALFRLLTRLYAYHRIEQFNRDDFTNPLNTIGLPDLSIPPRLAAQANDQLYATGFNEKSLGRRVSDEERERNLHRVTDYCRDHDIGLVIIHPAYRESKPHTCLLTRFCEEEGVPMFDAFPSLHPAGQPAGARYGDSWHPNREGHRQLARDLARFLERSGLLASRVGRQNPD